MLIVIRQIEFVLDINSSLYRYNSSSQSVSYNMQMICVITKHNNSILILYFLQTIIY